MLGSSAFGLRNFGSMFLTKVLGAAEDDWPTFEGSLIDEDEIEHEGVPCHLSPCCCARVLPPCGMNLLPTCSQLATALPPLVRLAPACVRGTEAHYTVRLVAQELRWVSTPAFALRPTIAATRPCTSSVTEHLPHYAAMCYLKPAASPRGTAERAFGPTKRPTITAPGNHQRQGQGSLFRQRSTAHTPNPHDTNVVGVPIRPSDTSHKSAASTIRGVTRRHVIDYGDEAVTTVTPLPPSAASDVRLRRAKEVPELVKCECCPLLFVLDVVH